jgi:hypothetical protein
VRRPVRPPGRVIHPRKVFDLKLPLGQVGYRAMDQRRAIKVLLRP